MILLRKYSSPSYPGKSEMKLWSDLYWSIPTYRTSSQIAFTIYFGATYQQGINLYLHHRLSRVAKVSRHHPISLIAVHVGMPKYHGVSLISASISRSFSLPALLTIMILQLYELIEYHSIIISVLRVEKYLISPSVTRWEISQTRHLTSAHEGRMSNSAKDGCMSVQLVLPTYDFGNAQKG